MTFLADVGEDGVLFEVELLPENTTEADLRDVVVIDTVKRLANEATLVIDDPDGTKEDDYPRGKRVLIKASTDGGVTYDQEWARAVQDTDQKSSGGADELEVFLVGYDHFLTTRGVFQSFTDASLETIAQTVIENFTPVNWNSAKVDFQASETLTREFRGQSPWQVFDVLVSMSADEEYGVDDDFEFFVTPSQVDSAPDILDGDWTSYDFPEEGSESYNRVEVFYGPEGDRNRVIVEDRALQQDLQTELGAPRPVVRSIEKTFPEITNEDAAVAQAREILHRQGFVLRGVVSSTERFSASPGNELRVQISEKNIDGAFRIASVEWNWGRDEALFSVVEAGPNVEQLLVAMVGDIHRIDHREADPDASSTQFLDIDYELEVEYEVGLRTREAKNDLFAFGEFYGGFGEGSAGENTVVHNGETFGGLFGARFAPWAVPGVAQGSVVLTAGTGVSAVGSTPLHAARATLSSGTGVSADGMASKFAQAILQAGTGVSAVGEAFKPATATLSAGTGVGAVGTLLSEVVVDGFESGDLSAYSGDT